MQTATITKLPTSRPATVRSRVTNKRRSFVDGDGNSAWARRWRDLIELHVADLGPAETLSEAQLSIVRRVSAIECQLEAAEGRLSKGEDVDLDAYTRAAGHLRRMLETLGIERKIKTIANPLADHFARPAHRGGAG